MNYIPMLTFNTRETFLGYVWKLQIIQRYENTIEQTKQNQDVHGHFRNALNTTYKDNISNVYLECYTLINKLTSQVPKIMQFNTRQYTYEWSRPYNVSEHLIMYQTVGNNT